MLKKHAQKHLVKNYSIFCVIVLIVTGCKQPSIKQTAQPSPTLKQMLAKAEAHREENKHGESSESEHEREAGGENEAEEAMARLGREEQYETMLAYPAKTVPIEARIKGYRLFQSQLAAQTAQRGPAAAQDTWQAVGPQKITGELLRSVPIDSAGRVTAILAHPTNLNIVYVGAAQGGVWKTTDGGNTWAALTDQQPSLSIGALAFDPNNPEIIYAGTGEPHGSDSFAGQGILKSSNGGGSWTTLGSTDFAGLAISDIVVSPDDPKTIYVAVANRFLSTYDPTTDKKPGVYKSTTGGTSWQLVLSACKNNDTVCAPASALVIDPTNANTLYAGLEEVGLMKTSNAGDVWNVLLDSTKLGTLFNNGNDGPFNRIEIAISRSNNQVMYIGFEFLNSDGSTVGYLAKTTDGGVSDQNWSLVTPSQETGYCGGQCAYDNAIAIHPTNPNKVFAGGQAQYSQGLAGIDGTLFQSSDGGSTWSYNAGTNAATTIHPDLHAIAIAPSDPNIMWVGVDGGIYKSTDGGQTWQTRNTNLGTLQFQSVALHPTDSKVFLGGMQDNAKAKTTDGGTVWTGLDAGDGGFTAIDPFEPRYWYGTRFSSSGRVMQFQRNDSAGSASSDEWPIRATGININDRVLFYAPLLVDPNVAGRVYWGTNKLYRSINRGDAWTVISPDLTKAAPNNRRAAISAIAVLAGSPANSNVIAVGTADGNVQISTNGGNSWNNVTKAPLPNRYVTDVAFGSGQTIYVSYAGYATNTPAQTGHVFRSPDGGNSWIDISNGLPDLPVWALVVDSTSPSTLYVADDFGVYRSADSGATWSPYSDGLPRVAIFDLALKQYPDGVKQLVAATHGRSMWRVVLAGNVPIARTLYMPIAHRDFKPAPIPTVTPGPSPTLLPTATNTSVPSQTPTPTPSPTGPAETSTPTATQPSMTNTPRPSRTPTPINTQCPNIKNCDFEKGRNGDWTEFSSNNYAIISTETTAQINAHSGTWLAWLGGSNNEVALLAQTVTIPAAKPYLQLSYFIGSLETDCSDTNNIYDVAYIRINDTAIGASALCVDTKTGDWVTEALTATQFAGQTVQVSIVVETDGSLNSNLFVDDVLFVAAPTQFGRMSQNQVPDKNKLKIPMGKDK